MNKQASLSRCSLFKDADRRELVDVRCCGLTLRYSRFNKVCNSEIRSLKDQADEFV
jgi:hypothetical protein